jgi:hypothetical protein
MKSWKREMNKIKSVDDAIMFLKKESVNLKLVDRVDLNDTTIARIEKNDDKARIIKSMKLYSDEDGKQYVLAISDYSGEGFGEIEAFHLGVFDRKPNMPDTSNVIFSLSKLMMRNAKYSKSWK